MSDACPHNVYTVGEEDNPSAAPVRIVHISDTHAEHEIMLLEDRIPMGDILIHSGDFTRNGRLSKNIDCSSVKCIIKEIDSFFSNLPHKLKIFIAGNHEINLQQLSPSKIQELLPHGIYLQDSGVCVEGINFYGSPWTEIREFQTPANGFVVSHDTIVNKWQSIPTETDVLVTHSPPHNILDLGFCMEEKGNMAECMDCNKIHTHYGHIGSRDLKIEVFKRIRPYAHLFGHIHNMHGTTMQDNILFSNGSLIEEDAKAIVIDFYVNKKKRGESIEDNKKIKHNGLFSWKN